MKKGILLVNLGTPDSLRRKDVGSYLKEFLGDPYVIDLPSPWRQILVNGIIVPFRKSKSQKMYSKVWTEKGSPLALNHQLLLKATRELVFQDAQIDRTKELNLQRALVAGVEIEAVMRYKHPSIEQGVKNLLSKGVESLVVIPLFPQYASSTHETIFSQINKLEEKFKNENWFKDIRLVRSFYNQPGFIQAFAWKITQYNPSSYDHIIFSYHSLPESHLEKIHPGQKVSNCSCAYKQVAEEPNCYKAQAYQTTRLLIEALNLDPAKCSTAFQSRFARKWVGPFTEELIRTRAQMGDKRVLIIAPSFVADCLETIYELGQEYRELFVRSGGQELSLVESLNDSTIFAKMLLEI